MAWQYDRMSINNNEAPGMQSRQGARRPPEGYYGENALTPEEELMQGRYNSEYQLGGKMRVQDYQNRGTALDPAANPRLRAQQRTGMAPGGRSAPDAAPRRMAPQSESGPLGMGGNAENDYTGRSLTRGLVGGYDDTSDTFSDGTPKPQAATKPLYGDVPAERQKIDIKFAPGFKQPAGVAEAFTGTGRYQGQPATRFPDDIHGDQPGTISNARQQFEQDIAHLHSHSPDPNDEAATRDWEDTNAGVMARMDQHATEARRNGNEKLARTFEAIHAGASPHEAVALTHGSHAPGVYQAQNASTAAHREQRLTQEGQHKQATAGLRQQIQMAHQEYLKARAAYSQAQKAGLGDLPGLARAANAIRAHRDALVDQMNGSDAQDSEPDADMDDRGGAGAPASRGESWRDYAN